MGEVTAAVVVAFLVPLLGYSLQSTVLSEPLILSLWPLVALNWAMVVTFQFPDFESDRLAGKRTLLVRLGHARTAAIFTIVVLAALVWMFAEGMSAGTLPARFLPLGITPVAVAVVWAVVRLGRGRFVRSYGMLTLGAITLFSGASILMVLRFWLNDAG